MRKQKNLLAFQAVKQLIRLDESNPDSHRCLIRFFHKISSLPAPGTDSEKLIWNVLEAERPGLRQLEGKSLVEVNRSFLEKHNDSLMHRVAAAEMMYLLEPEKKLQAIGLIEDSVNNTVSGNGVLGPVKEGKIQDCIRVHRLLKTVFGEQGAAERWKARCAEYFPYCTYFGGIMSAITTNSVNHGLDIAPENGLPSQQVKTKDEEGLSLNGSVHVVDGMNNLSIR